MPVFDGSKVLKAIGGGAFSAFPMPAVDRRNFGVGLLMQNPGDYFSLPSSQSALFELPRILENVL
jgi:hypothetical protein